MDQEFECEWGKNQGSPQVFIFGRGRRCQCPICRLQEGKDKKVGLGAVWWAKKRTKKYEEKKFLYRMLRYVGVFEALTIFFEDTKNFKIESMVLNRNYIDHGMNRKNVRKKDCIQLFLLLYNLCIVLEYKEIRELIKIR